MKNLITLSIFVFCTALNLNARNGGLQNCGSSCYFNSGIQTLSQLDSLNKVLDKKVFPPDSIPDLYVKLKNIIKDYPTNMPYKKDDPITKMTFIPRNYDITGKTKLSDFYAKVAAQFFPDEPITEQDSSEFVALLIHEFSLSEEEINSLFSPKTTRILTCKCKDAIKEIIALQDFRCGKGRDAVAKKMTALFIRVYLATHNATTLDECLNYTFRGKISKNKICPACTQKYNIQKFIGATPKNLILWLDRAPKEEKISNAITFEETLNIDKYLLPEITQNKKYKLHGIICHAGGIGGGHYWAYVKDKDGAWYEYNDSTVSLIDIKPIINQTSAKGNPYVLFYEREDTLQQKLTQLKTSLQELKEKLQVLQHKLIKLKSKLIT
ncbi:MAG: ubiquitin carboxyl-terminal hydrolase family protein [bacterium]